MGRPGYLRQVGDEGKVAAIWGEEGSKGQVDAGAEYSVPGYIRRSRCGCGYRLPHTLLLLLLPMMQAATWMRVHAGTEKTNTGAINGAIKGAMKGAI